MAKFKLGKLVATAAVVDKMQNDHTFAAFVSKSIRRYEDQDWGDSSDEEKLQNDYAVENGERVLASYKQDLNIMVVQALGNIKAMLRNFDENDFSFINSNDNVTLLRNVITVAMISGRNVGEQMSKIQNMEEPNNDARTGDASD